MEKYEVGQILYTTSGKSFKIIPIQVVEEVVRTTIEGKELTYMISFPNAKKTIVDIKKIQGKIFKNVNDVENHLIENTKNAIKVLIKEANLLKDEVFGNSSGRDIKTVDLSGFEEAPQVVQQDTNPDIIKVDLGNGQVGRIKKDQIKN